MSNTNNATTSNNKVFKTVIFRGGGYSPKPLAWVGLSVFISLILMLEVLTRAGIITSLTMPIPSDVFWTLIELWQSGLLFKHLAPSLSRLVVGSFIGCSFGICVGIIIGLFSLARAGLVPLVAAIFPIPKIALLPLFVIWFGIDETSKYALIALGTFT
ncbi:MAG: ABC transporter permease, partial [Rhodospirillaceae bacterium]|nr:ABC transporter permease [Rhodospirillaceae bacterium]